MLSDNRMSWRIGGVWWFSWTDEGGTCSLLRLGRAADRQLRSEARLVSFIAWTDGEPETVPLAQFPAR